MDVRHATLETCAGTDGAVVVIDVIRAFTTAAFAFGAGARAIELVDTVEAALARRAADPSLRVMGEVGGLRPPGFDFGNSPLEIAAADVAGRVLVQRTSAGTQGAVRCAGAQPLLLASFACARATVEHLRAARARRVTLVSTGPEGEDQACAAHLEALLRGEPPDPRLPEVAREAGLRRVADPLAIAGHAAAEVDAFVADVHACVVTDRFDFAMPVRREAGRLVAMPSRRGSAGG
jgi:2-phosphosulfolactate phosphatase